MTIQSPVLGGRPERDGGWCCRCFVFLIVVEDRTGDTFAAKGEAGADGGRVEQAVQRELAGGRLRHVKVPVLEARRARLSGDSRGAGDVQAAASGQTE